MQIPYDRDDFPREGQNAGQAIDACQQAMDLLARVDIVRALGYVTWMHNWSQNDPVPDNRSDFGHDMTLLEAAKTLWLLARYTAKEAANAEKHHDHLPEP
jgi:sucrose-6-phosphate hydrolase SacC (GH32 family)